MGIQTANKTDDRNRPSLENNTGSSRLKTTSLWVGLAFVFLVGSSLACRLEISTGGAAGGGQASIGGGSSQTLARLEMDDEPIVAVTAEPSETPTNPEPPATVNSAPIQSVTPAPTVTPTRPPTPTPTPVKPASQPPDRIRAAAIDMDVRVSPVGWTEVERNGEIESVWVVPDDVAGWHQDSALPGHGGNVVLSGHHNMGAEVFRYVVDLKSGDEVVLHADGRDYTYVVTDRFIIPDRNVPAEQRRQNAQWIKPTDTERLTLVTCWPYNDNSHRVIVIGNLAPGK